MGVYPDNFVKKPDMDILIKGNRLEFLMEKAFCFKNVKVLTAWAERPINQMTTPYLSFVLKGGNQTYTSLSPIQTSGRSFVAVDLMKQLMEANQLDNLELDTLVIKPYNFAMHPAQRIHVKLSVA
jgi:hypothetical protein